MDKICSFEIDGEQMLIAKLNFTAHMRYLIFIYLITGVFLTSCSYKQDQAFFERKNPAAVNHTQQNTANIINYHIKPQDILQITNVQNNRSIIDPLAGATAGSTSVTSNAATTVTTGDNYTVEDDGTIALPGLGRVQIAGLTRVEARQRIEELYGKELKQPLLDVKLVNLTVNVTGEVRTPGNVLLKKDRTTLIEVLGEVGGLTERSDETTIKIVRGGDNPKIEIIDLSDVNSLTDPRIVMQNNDIVYVSQNKRAVRATKGQAFSTSLQPVLLLLNTALIIYTLARK